MSRGKGATPVLQKKVEYSEVRSEYGWSRMEWIGVDWIKIGVRLEYWRSAFFPLGYVHMNIFRSVSINGVTRILMIVRLGCSMRGS
jgi:hypothetical protein